MIAYPVSILTELASNELSPSARDSRSVSVPNLPSARWPYRTKPTMKACARPYMVPFSSALVQPRWDCYIQGANSQHFTWQIQKMFCSNTEESIFLAHPSTITSYLASTPRQVLSHSRQCQAPAWPDRFLLWLDCYCMRDWENTAKVTLSDSHSGIWPTWSPNQGIFLPTSVLYTNRK